MRVFLDTSAFTALILKREFFHGQIVQKYEKYKQNRDHLITSDYILDELFTRCVTRGGSYGAKLALTLVREAIDHNEITVLFVDEHIFRKSEEIFLKFSEHKISFTDATTYVLYKDLKLDEIFTLDRDFKKMGLNTS